MSSESILVNPVIQFVIIFGASLLASLLLYGLLKSTGVFKSKGMQLGGAAAGFVIIFIVASQIFGGIDSRRHQEEINELNEEITALERGDEPGIECPDGFAKEISRVNGIAYAYPENWDIVPIGIVATYRKPVSEESEKTETYLTNIVIVVNALDEAIRDKDIVEKIKKGEKTEVEVLESYSAWRFKGQKYETSVYLVDNHEGLKTTCEYEMGGFELSLEEIAVINLSENRVFEFTLNALPGQIEENRKTFYTVINSVKFLD